MVKLLIVQHGISSNVKTLKSESYTEFDTKKDSLRTGVEPVRVEPNGFQVHLLNRSDTAAVVNALLI